MQFRPPPFPPCTTRPEPFSSYTSTPPMNPGGADMNRPSSVGPSRTNASTNTSPRSSTPLDPNHDNAGQPLVQPVARSRRTPIACTECRRRQVKCSGGSPRCERCEKRGIQCEYIPLHQQRAAAIVSSNVSTGRPQSRVGWTGGYDPTQTIGPTQASIPYWQQEGVAYPEYGTPLPAGFGQRLSAVASSSQTHLAGVYPQSVPPHPPANYGYGTQYGHAAVLQSSGSPLTVPATIEQGQAAVVQPQYARMPTHGYYNQSSVMTGTPDPTYDQQAYQHRRFSAPMPTQSSASPYPDQYYHSSPELYGPSSGTSEPSQTPPAQWTDLNNLSYPASGTGYPPYQQ